MMVGGMGDLYRNSFKRMNKNNTDKKKTSIEDMIEKNKEALNLTHGKGKRKKHKNKNKK